MSTHGVPAAPRVRPSTSSKWVPAPRPRSACRAASSVRWAWSPSRRPSSLDSSGHLGGNRERASKRDTQPVGEEDTQPGTDTTGRTVAGRGSACQARSLASGWRRGALRTTSAAFAGETVITFPKIILTSQPRPPRALAKHERPCRGPWERGVTPGHVLRGPGSWGAPCRTCIPWPCSASRVSLGETEAQRSGMTCPRSLSWGVLSPFRLQFLCSDSMMEDVRSHRSESQVPIDSKDRGT